MAAVADPEPDYVSVRFYALPCGHTHGRTTHTAPRLFLSGGELVFVSADHSNMCIGRAGTRCYTVDPRVGEALARMILERVEVEGSAVRFWAMGRVLGCHIDGTNVGLVSNRARTEYPQLPDDLAAAHHMTRYTSLMEFTKLSDTEYAIVEQEDWQAPVPHMTYYGEHRCAEQACAKLGYSVDLTSLPGKLHSIAHDQAGNVAVFSIENLEGDKPAIHCTWVKHSTGEVLFSFSYGCGVSFAYIDLVASDVLTVSFIGPESGCLVTIDKPARIPLLRKAIKNGARAARDRFSVDCDRLEETFADDSGPAQAPHVAMVTKMLCSWAALPAPETVTFCNDDTLELSYPLHRLVQLEPMGSAWRVFDKTKPKKVRCYTAELPTELDRVFRKKTKE